MRGDGVRPTPSTRPLLRRRALPYRQPDHEPRPGRSRLHPNLAAMIEPGIFTISGGTGPALVLNADGSANHEANPAAPGSTFTLLATGEGQTNPPGVDGKRSIEPYPQPSGEIEVRVGGRPAEIRFAAEVAGAAGILRVDFCHRLIGVHGDTLEI